MATHASPVIRTLSEDDARELLGRQSVGRIAFTLHDRVDIEPVHYVYDRGSLFGRTSSGSKLATLAHNPWVAAEVDEVHGLFEWRSVVARGAFYTVSPEGAPPEAAAWARGIELLRKLIPETGTPDDPVAFRSIIFQVLLDGMSGREATPGNR